jgi:hypothetical protein
LLSPTLTLPSTLLGLDFSCAPTKRKPLTLARGRRSGSVVKLDRVDELPTLTEWEALMAAEAAGSQGFLMACDFPFGLPRPFVQALSAHGPGEIPAMLADTSCKVAEAVRLIRTLHTHCVDRAGFQRLVDGWGQTWQISRPKGSKLLHRASDQAMPGISSTSPLQTRYVPVGKMYFEGFKRLVDVGVRLPGLSAGHPHAIALEAYPGLLAHELLGRRSYKSETEATPDRLISRMDLVDALEQGRSERLGLRLKLTPAQRDVIVADPKGDRLDAVLCLMQAAWAHQRFEQGDEHFGLPSSLDPVEGWILTA